MGVYPTSLSKITKNLIRLKMNKIKLEYYFGMTLTCLVSILLIPLYMLVRGVTAIFFLLVDTVMFPYQAMTIYHDNFYEKKAKQTKTNEYWKN